MKYLLLRNKHTFNYYNGILMQVVLSKLTHNIYSFSLQHFYINAIVDDWAQLSEYIVCKKMQKEILVAIMKKH